MKLTFALLLALLYSVPASAGTDPSLISARKEILSSSSTAQQITVKYTAAAKKTNLPQVTAEYAYALAYAGAGEAALYNIDRALLAAPLDPEVRFYLSEILNAAGLDDAAAELSAPPAGWLNGAPLKLPALSVAAPQGEFPKALAQINLLMTQKRYAESAVAFDRLCRANTDKGQCYAGYAIALERLGAYRSAAEEARKDEALTDVPEHKAVAQAYIDGLAKREPLKYGVPPEKGLKGRYLAYVGGNASSSAGADAIYTLNWRVGKFISDRMDLSLNGGYTAGYESSDYNGLTLGCSARYNAPLAFLPLNWTLGGKAERVPAPEDGLTLLVSPGLSYFMRDSSVDVYLDIALAGAYKGSRTLSVGYTFYFGGKK